MKKSVILFGLLFLFSALAISLVSAQALPAPSLTFNYLGDFFNSLLSGVSGDVTLVKVLLVMLLTTILFQPANKLLGKKPAIAFIVAFLVSVLGIKYLATYDLVKGLMLPYGALAIAVSSMLPFLLISYLLTTIESKTIRKLGWAIMAGSFILLWWFRWTDIGDLAWIYLGLGLICLAVLFWFDSTIRVALAEAGMENSKAVLNIKIANLNKEIADLYEAVANVGEDEKTQKNLLKQILNKEQLREDLVRIREQ